MNLKIIFFPIDLNNEAQNEQNLTICELIESKFQMKSLKNTSKESNEFYNNYLDRIQKHQQKKIKKEMVVQIDKKIKLISAFLINTEHYQTDKKCLIVIRVKKKKISFVIYFILA